MKIDNKYFSFEQSLSEKHGDIPVSIYAIQGIFLPIGINIGTDIGKNINIKVYSSIFSND